MCVQRDRNMLGKVDVNTYGVVCPLLLDGVVATHLATWNFNIRRDQRSKIILTSSKADSATLLMGLPCCSAMNATKTRTSWNVDWKYKK